MKCNPIDTVFDRTQAMDL